MKITDEMVRKGARALFTEKWRGSPEELPAIWSQDHVFYERSARALLEATLADIPDDEPMIKFQHYKGDIYERLHFGSLEADLSPVVIYRSLKNGRVWVRPEDDFNGTLPDGRRRFIPLALADVTSESEP